MSSDTLWLAEPLPCFACDSRALDDEGAAPEIREFNSPELELKRCGREYWLPGFVPGHELGEECDEKSPLAIPSMVGLCTSGNHFWYGTLALERHNGIYRVTSLLVRPEQQDLLEGKYIDGLDIGSYHVENEGGQIRLVPDEEAAIATYREHSAYCMERREMYLGFLDDIRHPNVPVHDLRSIVNEDMNELKRSPCADAFANTFTTFKQERLCAQLAGSALEAALVVLYHYYPDEALQLVEFSGVRSPIDFKNDFLLSRGWYFTGREEDGYDCSDRVNLFLRELKMREKRREQGTEETG